MEFITITSYILGIIGTILLSPHIIPKAVFSQTYQITKKWELNTRNLLLNLKNFTDNFGDMLIFNSVLVVSFIINVIIMMYVYYQFWHSSVLIYPWLIKYEIPIAIYLLMLSLPFYKFMKRTKKRLAESYMLESKKEEFKRKSVSSIFFSIIVMFLLPGAIFMAPFFWFSVVIPLIVALVSYCILLFFDGFLQLQLSIANMSNKTMPEKLLGYIGVAFVVIAATINIIN